MLLLLDASAILNEPNFSFDSNNEYITTQLVLNEMKSIESKHLTENALYHGLLKIQNPNAETTKKILKLISEKGFKPLSKADVSVIALAVEFKEGLKIFKVLTDDFSIQNFLKLLKIDFSSIIQGEIKEVISFNKKCSGCSQEVDSDFNSKQIKKM